MFLLVCDLCPSLFLLHLSCPGKMSGSDTVGDSQWVSQTTLWCDLQSYSSVSLVSLVSLEGLYQTLHDWRSHVLHLNQMVKLSYPPSLTPASTFPRLLPWIMWILSKPFTCWPNINSGCLHSRIRALALHLKGSSSMNSLRNTDLRPLSKLWTWKSET